MFFGTICSALGYLALSFVSPPRALVHVGSAGWLMGPRGFLFSITAAGSARNYGISFWFNRS